MKNQVYIVGNGCDRRLLDSQKLRDYFEANECTLVNNPKNANYIFVNTCAMSSGAEDTSVELVKRFQKYNAQLVAHGCLPQIAPDRFKTEFSNNKILTLDAKNIDRVDDIFSQFKIKYNEIPTPSELAEDQSLVSKFFSKFRFDINFFMICYVAAKFKLKNLTVPLHPRIQKGSYLQISSGCSESCTYCAIPRAIGAIKSKPIAACIHEYSKKLEKGERSFVFTADNIGLYGLDIGTHFAELLKKMSEVDQHFSSVRWILNELHPRWAWKYREELLLHVRSGKIQGLCIPIQSGSDRVLGLMKRHNKVEETLEVLKLIRSANPKLRLTTDAIIGFPGESDEEFLDTIRLITRAKFDQVMFFGFAPREGTPAENVAVDEALNKKVIIKRLKMAMKLLDQEKISYTYQ